MMSPQRKHAKRRNREARQSKRLGIVAFKGTESAMDSACFYVPYIPLMMVGAPISITEVTDNPGRWIWKLRRMFKGPDDQEVNDAITWAYENVQPGGWTLEIDPFNRGFYNLEIESKEDAVLFKMFVT